MTKSPCIGCELESADKNNPTCRECDRRVEYVALVAGDGRGIMGATNIGTEVQASPLATPGRQEPEVGDQKSEGREQEMNIEHVSRHSIAKPDRTSDIEHRIKKQPTECVIEGCERSAHARGLCHSDYKRWRDGDIQHPMLGKFYKIRGVKKQKSEVRSRKSERSAPAEVKKAALPPLVAVQLSLYPEIHKAVYDAAEKFFVTPEHVIIGLLGEALAARMCEPD
ncbi:MAG: hypothetical protein IMF10_09320 [Proteobacteria bacterium]|nr:hypothetical protein [Pseudomonadota bacterium]